MASGNTLATFSPTRTCGLWTDGALYDLSGQEIGREGLEEIKRMEPRERFVFEPGDCRGQGRLSE